MRELHSIATTFRESAVDLLMETQSQTETTAYYNYNKYIYPKLLSLFLLIPTAAIDSVKEFMLDLRPDLPLGASDKRELA